MGSKGVRAKWLRIELRKIETVPGGESWGELIGTGPTDVWIAGASSAGQSTDRERDGDGTVWEVLRTHDFPFRLPIPEALPPSAKLDKQCGIAYEIVSSLCIKTKRGLLKKEEIPSVIQAVQPIVLDKHELHSTWPAYNQPDTHTGERDGLRAKLRRQRYAFAPGDKVSVKVIVSSSRVEPAKIKSVAVTIKETVTFHGVKPSRKSLTSSSTSAKPSMQRVEIISQKAKTVGKKIYKGDSNDYDLECIIPKSHPMMSISTGKHIEVSYTLRVYVDISKSPIVIDHIPMMMTTFPRQTSLGLMRKIGFVQGLSERELLIDDDDDASTQRGVSRSVRPAHTRSNSYAGSSSGGGISRRSSGYTQSNLTRRDTVKTQSTVTGPGMAGRGVPGQLFAAFGPGYPPPAPFGVAQDAPRPMFAGPASIAEGNLTPAERAAMYHHSYDPDRARAAGVEYDDYGDLDSSAPYTMQQPRLITEEDEYDDPNSFSAPQRYSFAGYPTQQPPSRPQTASQAAELEKERLYERARQQAERNQRRAAQAQAMAQGTGTPAQMEAARRMANTPSSSSSAHLATAAASPRTEQEKLRLWERARREAEAYQRGFSEGATFPTEEAPRRPHSVQPRGRSSDAFWLDNQGASSKQPGKAVPAARTALPASGSVPAFPSAEDEKKRLYEQAKAQTEAHIQSRRMSASSDTSSGTGHHTPASEASSAAEPSVMAGVRPIEARETPLSEKEQMRRYYAAQDEVQRFQSRPEGNGADASASGSGAGGSAQRGALGDSSGASGAGSVLPGRAVPSEKDQLARYYAAQDEVQRYQAQRMPNDAGSSSHQYGDSSSSTSHTNGDISGAFYSPPSFEASTRDSHFESSAATSMHAPSSSVSEKEQMRRYHEARDREAASSSLGHGSNSRGVAAGNSGPSHAASSQPKRDTMLATPRATYAPNFLHGSQGSFGGSGASSPAFGESSSSHNNNSRSVPLPQAPFPGASAASGSNAKPRVGSDTTVKGPTGSASHDHQPPSLNRLSLNTRGSTPSPMEGPWAPKVATSFWDDENGGIDNQSDDEYDGPTSSSAHGSSHASSTAGPPLPPKVPLASRRGY